MKCEYCKINLIGNQRRFCCVNHAQLWNYHYNPKRRIRWMKYSKNYARRKRKNPEYRKKEKEKFEKWRKENRKHYNDLVRPKARIFMDKLYHDRRKKGLCVRCERKKIVGTRCKICADKENERGKKNYAKKKM